MATFWSVLFNVLIHAILIGAMVLFALALFRLAASATSPTEKLKRVLALFAGAMVVVGAQASGLSFAEFIAGSLASGRASSAAAAVVASAIAGIAGLGVGYLLVRLYRRNDVLAIRLICLVGMLALAAFIQSYSAITAVQGVFVGKSAAPNIAFAAGLVLIFIFTEDATRKGSGLFRKARQLIGRDSSDTETASPSDVSGIRDQVRRDQFDF